MPKKTLAIISIIFIQAFLFGSCKSPKNPTAPTNSTVEKIQIWEFIGQDAQGNGWATDTTTIRPGGASTHDDPVNWRIDYGGCSFYITFDVQFSINVVRLFNARKGEGTDCVGVRILTAFSDGNNNGNFPDATEATGRLTIAIRNPMGDQNLGGTFFARRIE
ncbi:hypothetical protein ACFLRM_03640 [Acidobacteriota bacterium]